MIWVGQKGVNGYIADNVLSGGPHCGIVAGSSGTTNRFEIRNNTISLKGRVSNDYAIQAYADQGSLIYNNRIECSTGEYACRGIYVGANPGTASYTKVMFG